jgi:hypothetical protein
LDASMRALPVVVADIFTKNLFEVALVHDEQPVQALRPDLWVPNMPSKGLTLPVRIRG